MIIIISLSVSMIILIREIVGSRSHMSQLSQSLYSIGCLYNVSWIYEMDYNKNIYKHFFLKLNAVRKFFLISIFINSSVLEFLIAISLWL